MSHFTSSHYTTEISTDEARIQRAWQIAHRVAATLYQEFQATHVAVFGSLAEQEHFSKQSDIDIAVSGIPTEMYFRAVAKTLDFSREFRIELVNFENCKGRFRERVQHQWIPIEQGKTYKVSRRTLIRRISDEHDRIEETVKKIEERLHKINRAPVEYREEIETTIAKNLVDCYRGIEVIFRRIALEVDLQMPDGSRWHKELLIQMAGPRVERPPVISRETFGTLVGLLAFHHVFNNIYEEALVYEQIERNATQMLALFSTLSSELKAFTAYLEKQEND